MDRNQIITNMKTTELFQSILLFSLLLCGLAACSDSDEIRLSPFQETTVKGEASTLQIDLTRGDWRITSITTPWGDLMMDGNKLPQLEGTGSLHYKWWDLERDTDSHLILHFKDNFDLGESRSLIINLEMKTGFYKEQIIIHQEPCTNFYQLESIEYSVEEGDGVEEIEPQPWGVIIRDYTVGNGETQKTHVWPFYNAYVSYSFHTQTESPLKWTKPEEDIYVDMPKDLSNGEIIYETDKRKYGSWHQQDESELKEKSFEVDQMNQKQNTYSADIYYKQLRLSYTMTLARPGNDTKKVFKGTLIKAYPYDCSPIRHEVSELPDKDE